MKRQTINVPGYDCMTNPCGKNGCGIYPGSSHGVHCDEWVYVVSDGDIALALTVSVGNFPRGPVRPPRGDDLTLHVAWPTEREEVRSGARGRDCEFVDGGQCFNPYTTALGADDFFSKHGAIVRGQPESFWVALEARCAELAKQFRAERADTKWERCSHCDATGTVRR